MRFGSELLRHSSHGTEMLSHRVCAKPFLAGVQVGKKTNQVTIPHFGDLLRGSKKTCCSKEVGETHDGGSSAPKWIPGEEKR